MFCKVVNLARTRSCVTIFFFVNDNDLYDGFYELHLLKKMCTLFLVGCYSWGMYHHKKVIFIYKHERYKYYIKKIEILFHNQFKKNYKPSKGNES